MVKESVSKKRKSNPDTESEIDIYKKVIEYEEKEALQRTCENDVKSYLETCGHIREHLKDMFELISEHKKENKTAIMEKRTKACAKVAYLKKLNRLEKFRTLTARDSLNQEKLKLDSIHLQYQNLLYELDHLVSEFKKCKQYKSKDEDIELISEKQFLEVGPEDVIKRFKDKPMDNNLRHELHLSKLEYELSQRITLSKLCDTLEDEKKELAKENIKAKEKLDSLGPRLTAIIEATKPLQEQLGLPVDKIRAEHKLARLLPDQLYILYYNSDAYKQINEIEMEIEILGDQEYALQYNEQDVTLNEPDSEPEAENVEEVTETKKRRHRKASQVDKHEEKKKKLLEAHPLSVEISMSMKNGPLLKVKFQYRTMLKIVTVTSTVDIPSHITGNSAREVLCGESLLNELFTEDFGKRSPNGSNKFQLEKAGYGSFEALVPKLGYAYKWAQRLCGLDNLNTEDKDKISQANIETVLKTLQRRLRARYALAEQLQQLEQNCISTIPDTIDYPKSAASTLTKWSSISFQRFCQETPNAGLLTEKKIAEDNDLFYGVTIARPKVVLHASVIIKNDYPIRSPVFIIWLKHNGDYNSQNSDEIRDMERAINVGWDPNTNNAGWLLSAQLRFLCSYLDVYLETTEKSGFPQTTVFFKNVCGRNRRRPFKYMKIGNGIFTQY